MNLLLDSFWRALAYCLRPRVVLLSLLPILLMGLLTTALAYLYWDRALDAVRAWLESSSMLNVVWDWLQGIGAGGLKLVLAPLILVFGLTPLIVLSCLLAVSWLMTPALTRLVAQRRFSQLACKGSASMVASLFWGVGSALLALLALLVSLPLWLVPPLMLVLPALIWGWLTYRVMAFDALSQHASAQERRTVLQEHRAYLLGMGIFCGLLGAAPSLLWASWAFFAVAFVLLAPLAIWIYTLVFVLSSLWFAHYCLAALEELRSRVLPSQPAPDALA